MPLWRAHWTPTYIVDKLAVQRWEKANQDKPWLVRAAVEAMANLIQPGDAVVEFGSGRSTVWFSRQVGTTGRVISVEDYKPWHEKVSKQIADARASNVEYLFVGETPEQYLAPATAAVDRVGGLVDAVLADGFKHRDHASLWALDRLKPGGLMIIDNINWYLPHATRTPASIGAGGRPATDLWARFAERTRGWRYEWFSSGVSDTAIFIVPPGHRAEAKPTAEVRAVGAESITSR